MQVRSVDSSTLVRDGVLHLISGAALERARERVFSSGARRERLRGAADVSAPPRRVGVEVIRRRRRASLDIMGEGPLGALAPRRRQASRAHPPGRGVPNRSQCFVLQLIEQFDICVEIPPDFSATLLILSH